MGNVQSTGSVQLPSRGVLYGDKVPDGSLAIRKLTVGDEVLLQSGAGGVEMISRLIQACVKVPQGMTHGELLVADRLAILIALRVHTFGAKYNYTYHCTSCGASNKAECDLRTDIKVRDLPGDLVEPVEVRLNDADVTVGLRFLRGKDEDVVSRASKRAAGAEDNSVVTRMALQLVTVNGKELGSQTEKEMFVKHLTLPDGLDFREKIDEREPGIDLRVYPECKSCGSASEISLPFGLDFFRPTRRQS